MRAVSAGNQQTRTQVRGGSRIFVRRGCTRLLLYFNTNKPHSLFFCRVPVVLENRRSSQGGGDVHPLHPPPRSAPATTTCSDQLHFHGEIGEELNRLFSPPGVSTSRLVAFSRFHFAHKEMSQAKAINSAVLNLLYRYFMWNTQTKESLSRLRALSDLPRPPASSPIHLPKKEVGIVTRVT